jgi:hypothetical protein
MRTYTFNECYERLHVDPKTFRGWLKEAGIDPDHQVSRADRRIRFLTEEQLERLAEDHGRLLRTPSQASDEAVSPGAFKLALDRIQQAEEEIARHPRQMEEAQRYVEDAVTQLRASINDHHITLNARITDLVLSSTEEFKQLQEQLQEVSRKVDQVAGTLAERLSRSDEQQQADRDEMKRLWEQLDARIENLATSFSSLVHTLQLSLDGLQSRQDDLFQRLSRLDQDRERDMAGLTALVTQEREQIWLKLADLSTGAESGKQSIVEIRKLVDVQEHRLAELSRLIQEGSSRGEAETSQIAQKKSPTRAKRTQQRASSE